MKKILSGLFSLIGILGGFIVSSLIYTISTDLITNAKNGDYAYAGYTMLTILIGTFFYMYISKIIKSIINSKNGNIIDSKIEKINLVLYIITLLVSGYFILSNRTTGDTPLFTIIIVGIFSIILAIRLYTWDKFYYEFYLAPIKLNKNLDKNILKENKKRLLFNILGLIVGAIFTLLIIPIHRKIFSCNLVSDKEVNNVLRIILIFGICALLLFVIDMIIMKISKKNYNKKFKYYYTIKDYFVDSFHIVYTLLSYILFVFVLKINPYLALLYTFAIKIIINIFLPPSFNPDFKPTISFSYSHLLKDNHSNSMDDIKFGFLSDGSSYFSMDLGNGISTTTFTNKDGEKTDVTSFDITDNLTYKKVNKR